MSTKNDILFRIRNHTGTRYEQPEIILDAITYEDKLKQFSDSLEAAGGQAVVWQPGSDINELIYRYFPEVKRIGSNLPEITCATFDPDSVSDPRELNNTDLAVVEGCFGVAENGAVWITQQVKFKALYFITTALVIIVDKDALVNNMHEAYRQIEGSDYKYGFFVSGPSKTADIEQALVLGAHGPMKVLVVLKE
nr:LUD domain-containing protein [Parabacteroides goldsteinii]